MNRTTALVLEHQKRRSVKIWKTLQIDVSKSHKPKRRSKMRAVWAPSQLASWFSSLYWVCSCKATNCTHLQLRSRMKSHRNLKVRLTKKEKIHSERFKIWIMECRGRRALRTLRKLIFELTRVFNKIQNLPVKMMWFKFMSSTVLDDLIKARSYKFNSISERNLPKCSTTSILKKEKHFQKSRSPELTTRLGVPKSSFRRSSGTQGWPSSSCYSLVTNSFSHSAACSKCHLSSRIFIEAFKKIKFSTESSYSSLARWCKTLCSNRVHSKFTSTIIWSSQNWTVERCLISMTSTPF